MCLVAKLKKVWNDNDEQSDDGGVMGDKQRWRQLQRRCLGGTAEKRMRMEMSIGGVGEGRMRMEERGCEDGFVRN